MTLCVTLWQWGSNKPFYNHYGPDQVRAAAEKIGKYCTIPHRTVVLTDRPELGPEAFGCEPIPLWEGWKNLPEGRTMPPGSWSRLGIFARDAHRHFGVATTDDFWVLNIDLDCVFLRDFTDTIRDYRDYTFKGWLSRGWRASPCIYNASFSLLKLGAHPEVFDSFDPVRTPAILKAEGYVGTEQAQLSRALGPNMPAWTWRDGIASYRFTVKGNPSINPAIVAMHGSDKPMWSTEPWVLANYPSYARRPRPSGKGPTG